MSQWITFSWRILAGFDFTDVYMAHGKMIDLVEIAERSPVMLSSPITYPIVSLFGLWENENGEEIRMPITGGVANSPWNEDWKNGEIVFNGQKVYASHNCRIQVWMKV